MAFFTKKEIIFRSQKSSETALSLDDVNYILYQYLSWSQYLQGNQLAAMEYANKAEESNSKNLELSMSDTEQTNRLDFMMKHQEFITKLFRRIPNLLSIGISCSS